MQSETAFATEALGQSEVADLGCAIGGEKNVGRLQIAMHNPVLVGRLNSLGQGSCEGSGLPGRLGRARQFLCQIAAVDKLHGEVGLAVLVAHVMDLNDVRMPQACDGFRFPHEAFSIGGTAVGAAEQHLQGDDAVEAQVSGLVNDAHAAATKYLLELIARDLWQPGRRHLR